MGSTLVVIGGLGIVVTFGFGGVGFIAIGGLGASGASHALGAT